MHPEDAAARGIEENSIVKVFNGRGALLAGVHLTQDILPGVVQMSTGAWYDPLTEADGRTLCIHGNPNAVTRDLGTSSLAQGCAGQLATVQVERFDGPLPPIRAFEPPQPVARQ